MSDAKRFFDILNHPAFIYFPAKPKTMADQKDFLRLNPMKRKNKTAFNFSIIFDDKHVGGCGVRINPHYPFIGEVGYFIDHDYWGKGIATDALNQLELFIFDELNLKRLELLLAEKNIASEQVAIKREYKKEGVLRKRLQVEDTFYDCCLYAKING